MLVGDYAFPEGLQDDPVYVTGRKFVVCPSEDDAPRIKTCLGTRFLSGDHVDSPYQRKPWHRRLVYWDDGTVTTLDGESDYPNHGWARPLLGGEMWVTEAMEQFYRLLMGQSDHFLINFVGGAQFVGKIVPIKASQKLQKHGSYFAQVKIVEEEKDRQGMFEFIPTPECPDAVAFLESKFSPKIIEILQIRLNTPRGKKWSGVFFDRSQK